MQVEKIIQQLTLIASDVEPVRKARIASAVVYRDKVISYGFNSKKSHPFAQKFQKNPHAIFLHAETSAILRATKRISAKELRQSTLFVVRVKLDLRGRMSYGLAKPCTGCQSCIDSHGIPRVLFTLDSPTPSYQVVHHD